VTYRYSTMHAGLATDCICEKRTIPQPIDLRSRHSISPDITILFLYLFSYAAIYRAKLHRDDYVPPRTTTSDPYAGFIGDTIDLAQ